MKNNETLTAEVKAEIESLVKMAEQSKSCMITDRRYAVQKGLVFDNKKGWLSINVTRYIHNYGSGIVSVQDVIDECAMYSKRAIEEAHLTPISEKEIAKHGKVTKFVIDDENGRRTYIAE